jgi:hypothetical protein
MFLDDDKKDGKSEKDLKSPCKNCGKPIHDKKSDKESERVLVKVEAIITLGNVRDARQFAYPNEETRALYGRLLVKGLEALMIEEIKSGKRQEHLNYVKLS